MTVIADPFLEVPLLPAPAETEVPLSSEQLANVVGAIKVGVRAVEEIVDVKCGDCPFTACLKYCEYPNGVPPEGPQPWVPPGERDPEPPPEPPGPRPAAKLGTLD